MRPKEVKIWVGRRLNEPVKVERRSTLKSLCAELGVSYSTAKVRQAKEENSVTLWMVDDVAAWEVWFEIVKK